MTTREIYLNHAGTSWPKPQVVSQAVRDAMIVSPSEWPKQFDAAHQAIADFFGVNRREQVLITPGCTSALSVAIGDALIPHGKRVLTSRWEHHALSRPLLKLASKGVRVEYIPPRTVEGTAEEVRSLDLDWLEGALCNRDVGLVAITAACNVTGELLPYEDVIRMAHDHEAMVLLDAAQIVGWQKLNFSQLGADMVAFGGHKGLQGPWGIGGLYVSDQAQMECTSAACAIPVPGKRDSYQPRRPGYCDVGSVDQVALAGLNAGVRMLGQQNVDENLAIARQQIQRIHRAIDGMANLRVYGAFDDGMPSIAFAISGATSSQVATHLARHKLVVGSGIHCAPLAHETMDTVESGLVRVSVGVGQPDEEVAEAIARLQLALNELSRQ